MSDAALFERSAFAGLAESGRFGAAAGEPGVILQEAIGIAMASIIARKGQGPVLAAAARRAFGVELPQTPRRAATVLAPPRKGEADENGADLGFAAQALAFTWAGPQQWLVSCSGGGSDALAQKIAAAFTGLAAVAAQGDGRAVLQVRGPRAGDTLAKGLPIDLHESVFKPGDTAFSVIAHMAVQITQLDSAPTYEIALMRSFAGAFWHWLTLSAAEYGYAVNAPAAEGRG